MPDLVECFWFSILDFKCQNPKSSWWITLFWAREIVAPLQFPVIKLARFCVSSRIKECSDKSEPCFLWKVCNPWTLIGYGTGTMFVWEVVKSVSTFWVHNFRRSRRFLLAFWMVSVTVTKNGIGVQSLFHSAPASLEIPSAPTICPGQICKTQHFKDNNNSSR